MSTMLQPMAVAVAAVNRAARLSRIFIAVVHASAAFMVSWRFHRILGGATEKCHVSMGGLSG
ncbi:MAG: hypothetical protein M9895_17795 [Aquamicrobium sp.]|uniref:hypothetical protein n=1 Tax=Aquamicrobium sp. TaxID=1872579 RepID=UPI00349E786E|nr:hypothetical protein [Aquamicrobium sp.]MCO5155425.1 hypothetical protein [Aquamicrobium sp.]